MERPDPRVADLVQAGRIRLALFLPQYTKDAVTGQLRGIGTGFLAIEIIRSFATRLGVEMRLVEHPTPPTAVDSIKTGACDVACLGIEPSRAAEIDFTPPAFQFDYTMMVPIGSPIRGMADADRRGIRIAVVNNHASTFALGRLVKAAALVGSDVPDTAFGLLRAGDADAFALPREQLLDYATQLPGAHVLEESYGINRVAVAVRKGCAGRLAFMSEFIMAAKASGLIRHAIERGGLRGFEVAPAERPA
jgi:polar amino acid transport system substrate-binding protein